ncbi:MAG TPA: hypothetical protein VGT82_08075, partial [Ktedonobacteraceae bacterium]|nr:hypothetical protein [Ktedonobacteraceae bacterium]
MAHITPQLNDTILTLSKEGRYISLGSMAWWQWLSDEGTTTFRVKSAHGSFTARREQKGGSCYWYAYRKHRGRLHKAYLGKSEELGQARLEDVAAQLTARMVALHPSNPAARVVLTEAQDTKAKGASPSAYHKQAPATVLLAAQHISDPLYAQDRLQSPLLATKFYLPPARSDLVARPRLIERLASGVQRKLTLVAAPAGFGKTTLLSSWQATARTPYAWLALDAGDNDPVRFWTYVAATLRDICPTVQEKMAPLLQMLPLPPIESLLTVLINECTARDSILILDDYHLIATQAIHDGMQFLLEHLPARMHMVLVSRSDPPLPLTKLRARGELTEIRAQDLRFTPDEATAFLNSVMGLQLSHAEVAALDAHTEGWAAGLQLAALSLQGRRNQAGARDPEERDLIVSFTGNHRFILDYLTGEVLQQQPASVRAFLLSTSLLDRLNAQLCNALTGQEDGQVMLERLERANLFLIPLDEERRWYRYHHLFADFLRVRLQQEQPSLVPQLHIKAARWYEQHDLLTEAVEHALAAPDLTYAAQLLDKVSQLMHMRGEVMTFLHWLSQLPQEAIRARPELRLFQAAAYMAIGQLDTAEDYPREVEQTLATLRQLPEQDPIFLQRLESELIGSRSVLAAFRGDLPQTIELSQRALQLLPEENAF